LPLNVGNTWVYSNSKRVYNDTIYVSGTTKLNGETDNQIRKLTNETAYAK